MKDALTEEERDRRRLDWIIGVVGLIVLGCLLVIAISTYRLTQISVDTLRMDCSWLNLVCE
jgi:hypothetical protein